MAYSAPQNFAERLLPVGLIIRENLLYIAIGWRGRVSTTVIPEEPSE
jgi:hypothetical protein